MECIRKLFASVLVMFALGLGEAWAIEEHVCMKTPTSLQIDGVLDEAAWTAAEQLQLVNAVDASEVQFPTTAKMIWNEANLYVAFVCTDPDMWATITERDGSLWEEEVVEVFIDPDGDGEGYAELEVSPTNVVVDLKLRPSEIEWDIVGLETAVVPEGTVGQRDDEDQSWTVEIAIPWAALADIPGASGGPPQEGERWRLNLYRIERPAGAEWELQAWSPVWRPSFHTPEQFGAVTFSDEPVTSVEDSTLGRVKATAE